MIPSDESLRAQLQLLNERNRWYGSQMWQLPLAYVGLAAVTLASVPERGEEYLPWLLLVISGAGFSVVFHTVGLHDAIRRGVTNIERLEGKLGVGITVEYRPVYNLPLQLLILGLATASLTAAWRQFQAGAWSCMSCILLLLGIVALFGSVIAILWEFRPDPRSKPRAG